MLPSSYLLLICWLPCRWRGKLRLSWSTALGCRLQYQLGCQVERVLRYSLLRYGLVARMTCSLKTLQT